MTNISAKDASMIEKQLISEEKHGRSVTDGYIVRTYSTNDGDTLTHSFGNGGESWTLTKSKHQSPH